MKLFLILLVFVLPSSQWIVTMHYNTLRIAYEYDLTIRQKYFSKLDKDYLAAEYIVNNYPKDAMIYINKEDLPKGSLIKNKAWLTYFIFPRRVKYE